MILHKKLQTKCEYFKELSLKKADVYNYRSTLDSKKQKDEIKKASKEYDALEEGFCTAIKYVIASDIFDGVGDNSEKEEVSTVPEEDGIAIKNGLNGILEDLEIETILKERIDAVLFSNLSTKKKRIAIRKLKK